MAAYVSKVKPCIVPRVSVLFSSLTNLGWPFLHGQYVPTCFSRWASNGFFTGLLTMVFPFVLMVSCIPSPVTFNQDDQAMGIMHCQQQLESHILQHLLRNIKTQDGQYCLYSYRYHDTTHTFSTLKKRHRAEENGYRNMASLGLDIFDSKKFFKCLSFQRICLFFFEAVIGKYVI